MTQTLRRYFFLMLTLFLSISSAGYAIIRSNMLHKEQLKSGMQFDEKITLFNNQSVPVEIEIKQADYRCNAAGENFFSQPGTEPLSNAEWIKLPTRHLTLLPNQETTFSYTVNVPKHDLPDGSYSSVLLIEPKQSHSSNDSFITVKVRYAYLIVTSIGKGGSEYRITNKELTTIDDRILYQVDMENPGKYFIHPYLRLQLFDGKGKVAYEHSTPPHKLLPDNSIRFFFSLTELPSDSYKGILFVNDENNQYKAEPVRIVIPDPSDQHLSSAYDPSRSD